MAKLSDLFQTLGYKDNPRFHFYSSMLRHYDTTKEEKDFKYLKWNQFIQKHYSEDKENVSCQDYGLYKKFYRCLEQRESFNLLSAFCAAQYGSYLFDPKGNIYTCLETIGKANHVIGSYINQPVTWTRVRDFWQNRMVVMSGQCQLCKYALLCGGGCLNRTSYDVEQGFGISACTGFPVVLEKSVRKAYKAYMQHNKSIITN